MIALREHGQIRKYVHEREGLDGPPRHDSGGRPHPEAGLSRRLEPGAAGRGRLLRHRARRRRRPASSPVAPASEPAWHVYVVRTADLRPSPSSSARARHRHGAPIRSLHLSLPPPLGYRRPLPGRRGARRRVSLAAALPGDHGRAARRGHNGGGRVLRPWALVLRRPTRRRTASSATSPSARTTVYAFTNLYGCTIRRPHAHRPLRRDPGRRRRGRRLQGAEPHVHLRRRGDRRRGVRRPRSRLRERQDSAVDHRRRPARDRGH